MKHRVDLLQQYIKSVRDEIQIIESAGCTAELLASFASYPVIPNCTDFYINSLNFPLKPSLIPYSSEAATLTFASASSNQEYVSAESEFQADDNTDIGPPRRRGRSYSSASSKSNKQSDNEGDGSEAMEVVTTKSDANSIKYTYGKNSKKVRFVSFCLNLLMTSLLLESRCSSRV